MTLSLNVQEEYRAVRERAGVMDLSHHGKIQITGTDRAAFLHNLVSNDIKNLAPGACCYATLLTPKGKMIADLHVYAMEDRHWLDLGAQAAGKVIEHLSKFLFSEDVRIQEVTGEFGLLSLQGARAAHALAEGLAGIQCFENDRTGSGGYDVWMPAKDVEEVLRAIRNQGGVAQICHETWEILRIEAGRPVFGRDMDENTIPNEAGLERAISWTKGCYPGQEIVARIKYRGGVQRVLSGLVIEGATPPAAADRVFLKEAIAGWVTSSVYSYCLESAVALATLRTPAAREGTALEIRSGATTLHANVCALPFYRTPV